MTTKLGIELNNTILKCPRLPNHTHLKKEQRLSIEVANMLRAYELEGRLDCIFCTIPNEGKRSQIVGSILKAMGLVSGACDLVIMSDKKTLLIELKTDEKASKQTPNQKLFEKWAASHNIPYKVCESVEDVESLLIEHKLLKIEVQ